MSTEQLCMDYVDPDLGTTARKAMYTMQQSGELCDVTLNSDDVIVPAHKLVLASATQYFRSMFTLDFQEKEQTTVTLAGVCGRDLECLVKYMYTGEIDVNLSNVRRLLPAANMLQLSNVSQTCAKFLTKQLTPGSCLELLDFVCLHNCEPLVNTIQEYIGYHFTEVSQTEKFLSLSCQSVGQIIAEDTVNVCQEEEVYAAMINWVQHDVGNRSSHISSLLPRVRLQHVTNRYLKKEYLIKSDDASSEYVTQALEFQSLKPEERLHHQLSKTQPRHSCSRIIFIVNGYDGIVENYDLRKKEWTPESKVLAAPRKFPRDLVVVRGVLYAVAGSTIDSYDAVNDCWKQVTSYRGKRGLAVGVLHNNIYCLGTGRYDPSTNEWETISSSVVRCEPGLVELDGKLFVIGGAELQERMSDTDECFSSAEYYDDKTDTWTEIAEVRYGRKSFGAAVLDGAIYIVGGSDDNMDCLDSVEKYNAKKNEWSPVASLNTARVDHAVVAYDGLLYAIGGRDWECLCLTSVEVYDPKLDEWTFLASGDMRSIQERATAAVISKLRDFVLPEY